MGSCISQFRPNFVQGFVGGIGIDTKTRLKEFTQPIKSLQGLQEYDPSVNMDKIIPPTNLPAQFIFSEEEVLEQKKRWSTFADYMSKPFNYPSKFKKQLQELDSLGAINLKRTNRDGIPNLNINYAVVLFFNSYEGLPHTFDGSFNNALNLAKLFVERKYRVFYMNDATPMDYYKWMNWLIDKVQIQLLSYYSGYGIQIPNNAGDQKDALSDVLLFYNEKKKDNERIQKITPINGITEDTISNQVIHEMIIRKEFPQKRIVLINDICNSKSLFNFHQSIIGLNANIPPPNVVSIDLILNEEQFKQIKHETELFSFNFAQLLRQKPAANFNELNEYMKNKITKYNRIVTTGYNKQIYSDPVIYDMKLEYAEIQLSDISQYLQTRTRSASFNQYNQYNEVSDVEFREAKKRWGQFTSELKLGTNYPSKFNQQLNKLDQIGAINLDRIRREQIPPNILIENCIALFFNPYEGLPHTLDSGPVNDAHLMAELYISKGYNVVYLCDATPHEYYKWMDWLLSNVKKELVSYFSGHGTQIPDETGQEVDGLSEVLVFYNSNKKTSGEKITALKGITNETVSDTVMHDLIISKDYPNTRIVLITDCCHSGTMFNFDLPLKGKLNSPKTNRINVICVGAALDAQTAKQTVQGKIESGVFTFNFVQFIKTKQTATFIDLEKYMKKNIQKYQTIQITSNNPKNLKDQIISSVRGVIKRGIEQEIEIDENENENENERERENIKYKELKKEEYKQQKETKKSESQYRRDEKPKMDQSKKEEVNKEKNSKEDKKKSERKKEKDKNINKNEKKNKK